MVSDARVPNSCSVVQNLKSPIGTATTPGTLTHMLTQAPGAYNVTSTHTFQNHNAVMR